MRVWGFWALELRFEGVGFFLIFWGLGTFQTWIYRVCGLATFETEGPSIAEDLRVALGEVGVQQLGFRV